MLSQPHAGRSRRTGTPSRRCSRRASCARCTFRSDDLDATFEKVAAAPGVEVLEEPVSQPWGARDCAVRDPAGNLIRIEQL